MNFKMRILPNRLVEPPKKAARITNIDVVKNLDFIIITVQVDGDNYEASLTLDGLKIINDVIGATNAND